ncbi:MAG TPA: class I SAM-dependent methyltransferase [Candidatus Limnocylindrales bacterium]|nr:class I SAM-dependent methyltransferase [Candidatus Limnocylindrales bacterium]
MTDQAERYDKIAAGYARWWAPVIAPRAVDALELLEPVIAAGAKRILDVGTGTGTLAIGAIQRWPDVEVTGIDASREMAEAAEREADRLLARGDRRRFATRVAFADELPFDDGEFDAAMSSFVFQLVPNRAKALREVRRVLRPGGTLAYVTWLTDDRVFLPDIDLDDALDEIGIGPREPDGRPGDVPSVDGAIRQLRRAGYENVTASRTLLEHPFDIDGYVAFITQFDEADTYESLEPHERVTFERSLRTRLQRRSSDELVLRLPVVAARGVRT